MKLPLSQQKGFFAEYYLKLRDGGGASCEADIAKLGTCGNDEERVAYVDQLAWVRAGDVGLQVQREYAGKSAQIASELKERATAAFKQKKWLEAMLLYSRSYVALPSDKGEFLGVVYYILTPLPLPCQFLNAPLRWPIAPPRCITCRSTASAWWTSGVPWS